MRVNYYSKDYIFPIGIYQDSTDSKYYNGFFYNGTRVFFYRHITGSGIEYYSDSSFDPTRVYQFSATKVDDIFQNGGVIGLYRGLNFWVDMGSSGTNQISGNESVLKIRQNSNDEEVSAYTDIDSLPLAYDNGSSSVTSTVKGYKDLSEADLADSKLVKIIELPYCPSDITYQNGAYILNSSFVYNGLAKSLKYSDLRQRFKATLSDVTISELGVNIPASTVVSRAITAKNKSYESKLLNSDFYIYKLVYDGVYKQLKFENFDLSAYNSIPTMTVTFVPTNTIGSDISFAYSFNSATYSDETDFPVLISNRDNSLPIYNNDYINYMRYTYASDRANLDASARQSAITNGWSIAGAVAGTAASGILVKAMLGATAGSGAGVTGAVIGATIGAATSIAAAINAKLQADVNIENSNRTLNAKVDVLRNQPVTVQGASSSIDIMKEYSNNKLRVIKYEPSTLFKDAMYDKLFYCGYAHPVQEVPSFTSRYWFNYVQCTPEFTGDTNAYSKYLDDIKARFEIGVTDYHYHKLLGGYDWDQTKENWETNLLSGIDAWDGRTTISGFLREEDEVVVGYVTSSQPSSLFDWYYMVGTQDPVSFSFSSETSATIEFASYPGPVIIIAKNKGDTTIQSPFEID